MRFSIPFKTNGRSRAHFAKPVKCGDRRIAPSWPFFPSAASDVERPSELEDDRRRALAIRRKHVIMAFLKTLARLTA